MNTDSATAPDDKKHVLSDAVIERLLPRVTQTVADVEARYPERDLPEGAEVTRIAPSPTGFMHLGVLYASLISERIAHQSGGVFFLRIEDTDRKREVEGAGDFIVNSLAHFSIPVDEGVNEHGNYGPYTQSHREDIYRTYIRQMLRDGIAYPCFMTPEELDDMTARQNVQKVVPGYHGSWAAWRDRPEADVVAALDADKPYVIRFRSPGDAARRVTFNDIARGTIEMPENNNDIVIMKRDGLPTYHLAHVIDDHLMKTTLVVRGDEWLASVPLHMQLCEALGYQPFRYAHIAPLQKTEGSSRRKLSKRKDPEANVSYYTDLGYLPEPLIEYLLNQANSSYESWRAANPDAPLTDFPLSINNLSKSGGLFSLAKLDSLSEEYLARLSATDLLTALGDWAKQHDPAFYEVLVRDPDYTKAVLNIERTGDQPRKDMKHLSEAPDLYGYFYDDIFDTLVIDPVVAEKVSRISAADTRAIIDGVLASHEPNDSNEIWFEKLKKVGEPLGFTPAVKEFRKHPELYKGSVADVAMIIRVALTKRNQTPSLHEVMGVMGIDRVTRRLHAFADSRQ